MTVENLYLPEKYKVFLGKGQNVGFCTVWNDPDIVLKAEPRILDHVAILGTLYSREGVNIILRNLCLNPQITHVLVWANGNLSNTPLGVVGREILEKLWRHGINDDGTLQDTNFSVHPTMDVNVIRKVIDNVELVDVSGDTLPQTIKRIEALGRKELYMDAVSFPEFKRSSDSTLPSEEAGFVARGKRITDAWTKVVDRIMRYGTIKSTEYGNSMRELQAIMWVVESEDISNPHIPNWDENLKHLVGLDRKSLEDYVSKIFFDPVLPEGTAYTYGNRLMAYPADVPLDQVRFMINKIKECEVSRRAVSVLLYPPADQKSKSPPCLDFLQVLVNEGRLNMFAVYRSHDIFKAGLPNAFGMRSLQSHIARATGHDIGKLVITSNSAHIYEEDWENAKKLCMCEIWERPVRLAYDEINDADPRGSVVISIVKDRILADLISPTGEPLMSFEGTTGKEVAKKLAQLDLILRPDHWADIGMELQKAEIAKNLKIEYRQDQPLKF